MKRVYCLYRVSTMKQADGADIPMQRQACTAFAAEKGWCIEKEYYERGVSGFSVSANDRDAIQSIKNAAMQKAFDILLVFMFDRLGRRDDETPFVVDGSSATASLFGASRRGSSASITTSTSFSITSSFGRHPARA